jgi:hypothetical protein
MVPVREENPLFAGQLHTRVHLPKHRIAKVWKYLSNKSTVVPAKDTQVFGAAVTDWYRETLPAREYTIAWRRR